jgi:beta-fructofuranosidase
MIPRGTREEQDHYVYSGSLFKEDDTFYFFYTGHNPFFPEKDIPCEGIMRAASKDLVTWEKVPGKILYSRKDIYERDDWRDPFVFWNEEQKEYWMLVTSRLKKGPSRRRGCIALCTSVDLENWEVQEPFWAPHIYYALECPDLFRIGDWWYLVFSTFSDRSVTHYRMSRSLEGPWIAPENDTFDGRAFYAAKTCFDGRKRYVFGWDPTRKDNRDYYGWEWGGRLIVHEIMQQKDGSLVVKVPDSIDGHFKEREIHDFKPVLGKWNTGKEKISVDAGDSYTCILGGMMPDTCKISVKFRFSSSVRNCGVTLRATDDGESGYYIRCEPGRNRLVFDAWPRRTTSEFAFVSDNPFMVELERPILLKSDIEHQLKIFVEGSVCVAYLDENVAMSTRIYDLKEGKWGFFVQEGKAEFYDFNMWRI